jgi:fibronectin type 3 domain-containing protein
MARVFSKFLALTFGTAMLTGCAQIGVPVPPSLELPKPVNDLRAMRKGEKVHLSWTPPTRITDGETIRYLGPTRICHSLQVPMTRCDTVAGEVPAASGAPAKNSIEYTDQISSDLVKPDLKALASYAVEVLNSNGRSAGLSNQLTVPLFPTLPPPQQLSAKVTPQGVLLEWSWPEHLPEASPLEFGLRIYRREENAKTETRVGQSSLRDHAEPRFIDESLEWERTYYYRVTFVSVASDSGKAELEVEGDDSPEVKVVVHDVFPPAAPTGLQAVFSSVGQPNFIDLTWSPNSDAELAGYNVYRREEDGQAVKINPELAKIPTYRDGNIQPGKKYFYSITAVDLRGNESAHSEESSENVPEGP